MIDALDVEITTEDVAAAQSGEEWAIELILGSMRSRVSALASAEARRMFRGDAESWAEEFKQVADVAMWGALETFNPDAGTITGYLFVTARRAIAGAASEARFAGVDRDAHRTFAYWVAQCDGDTSLAEQMAQRFPDPNGNKLGRDRAHAAHLAWHNPNSIEGFAAADPNNDEAFPPTRYADLLVSTLGIPEEFITSDDISRAESSARHEITHAVLATMGEGAASVLRLTFGIDGYGAFGVDANDEIGSYIGKTAKQVIDARTKGYKAFADRFIKVIAQGDESEAASWWDAFRAERNRSNARGNRQ